MYVLFAVCTTCACGARVVSAVHTRCARCVHAVRVRCARGARLLELYDV